MRNFYIILIILFFATTAFADELKIPMSCFPKQLQAKFAERGYKLDLSANDREENSWGFIESHGSDYSIFTYRHISKKAMNDVREIVMGGQGG